MDAKIVIGQDATTGQEISVDLEELLATRLLVQGNSGSGKSHLLRRLLEESAGRVQQVVIDPEGDFVSLADHFGHVVVDGAAHSSAEIATLAARTREHRASVVLALEGLDVEQQIRCAAMFLTALFDAPREHWFPVLVVVDEAQMFAPAVAGEINEDTRRMTLSAMTNLMCRGRKRGLAGIVATQRLAKLAKNVAAEASNFLMGRTFLDIDMLRAADLLGMERRQAERIRDLQRGCFLGLGPAISRRPISVKIGAVRSGSKGAVATLVPPPSAPPEEMEALLRSELASAAAERPAAPPPPPPSPHSQDPERLAERIADFETATTEPSDETQEGQQDQDSSIDAILRELADEPDCTFQPASSLYQMFLSRCRARRISSRGLDMTGFRRSFAVAVARLDSLDPDSRAHILQLGTTVDDDLLAPFLTIAKAAAEGFSSPDEDELARVYGTNSPGRIRRLLDHLEKKGLITVRDDFGGGRTIAVPGVEAAATSD
ncbi:ATP-binding protein [Croceicoccus estronivorus]|uniref:ATP-binding protein n=1 Tax=Croceicoccus estronivorus TaxID=1172626 RepID=UPI00082EBE96|nr:ATP-binding protein [Croceicoccus estronivorus]OCC22971.1 ATP-binding protein [Croceicoccus estronivorus]